MIQHKNVHGHSDCCYIRKLKKVKSAQTDMPRISEQISSKTTRHREIQKLTYDCK